MHGLYKERWTNVLYQIKTKVTLCDAQQDRTFTNPFCLHQPGFLNSCKTMNSTVPFHTHSQLFAAKANSLGRRMAELLHSDYCSLITGWLAFLWGFGPNWAASSCQLEAFWGNHSSPFTFTGVLFILSKNLLIQLSPGQAGCSHEKVSLGLPIPISSSDGSSESSEGQNSTERRCRENRTL